MYDVWVTGVGVVSALGAGLEPHAAAVAEAKTGLSKQTFFNGHPPDPCMCAQVPHEVLPFAIEESAANRADLLLEAAVRQSLASAGLTSPVTADIFAGTTLGNMHGGTRYYQTIREQQRHDVSLVKHFLSCAPVAAVAKKCAVTGKRWTVASACGSAAAAIGHAFQKIRHGTRDRILAGGFEALSSFVVAGFNSLQLVSKKESKPFDKDRDGLNPGEGAAILVLESDKAAMARGATPLAKITGFGDALDAYHHTRAHPEGEGLIAAIKGAMHCAGVTPASLDHVHLHGTGTIVNDTSEFKALSAVFGNSLSSVPACSTKPMTGHTFGASGALNAVFSILSIHNNIIPATRFHENLDDSFTGLRLFNTPQKLPEITTVLSTSLGFGGEAFALIIEKADT